MIYYEEDEPEYEIEPWDESYCPTDYPLDDSDELPSERPGDAVDYQSLTFA